MNNYEQALDVMIAEMKSKQLQNNAAPVVRKTAREWAAIDKLAEPLLTYEEYKTGQQPAIKAPRYYCNPIVLNKGEE